MHLPAGAGREEGFRRVDWFLHCSPEVATRLKPRTSKSYTIHRAAPIRRLDAIDWIRLVASPNTGPCQFPTRCFY